MRKLIGFCLFVSLVLTGCGGGTGGGDVFIDDPFFDDGFVDDLIAIDDEFSTFQNQALSVGDSNGVLSNDIICCEDFDLIFPTTTASGGTIVGQDDGSFVYTPPQNFTGTDFFDYRLEDDFGSSTGNVIIAVNAPPDRGFFVDNLNGNDTTGSSASGAPFASIQAALAAAGVNGTVVVRPGNGLAYPGTINLLNGQSLLGEGFENINPQGRVLPLLTGPINLADSCNLRGLRVQANGTAAVNGASSVDGDIRNCELTSNTDYALNLDAAQGSWIVDENLFTNSRGGIEGLYNSGQFILSMFDNSFQNNQESAMLLEATGSSDVLLELKNSIISGHLAGFAVHLQSRQTGSFCLDISNNQNDDAYRLTRDVATFEVEELNQLGQLNTGNFIFDGDALQSLADGACGF